MITTGQPLDTYRALVFENVRRIPEGLVMTYGGIAALIPPPSGIDFAAYSRIRARWVGYALKRCPDEVPWHRVVNSQGQISPRHGLGPTLQRTLLEDEGIEFDERGRLDLEHYGWDPPPNPSE